jgi:hypothetical protein
MTNADIDDYTLAPWSAQAKSMTLASSRFSSGCKILGDQTASLMQNMRFMRYCMDFFVDDNRLWRKDSHGAHKLVIPPG